MDFHNARSPIPFPAKPAGFISIIYKKEQMRKDESGRLAGGDEKTGFPGWKAGWGSGGDSGRPDKKLQQKIINDMGGHGRENGISLIPFVIVKPANHKTKNRRAANLE